MDIKTVMGTVRAFYEQRPREAERFVNAVADFLLENRDDPAIVDPGVGRYVPYLHNIWTTNALPEIVDGRLFISEALINSFIGTSIRESESFKSVKSVDINCYGSGVIDCMVEHSLGRFLIRAEIAEWVHDNRKSCVVFCINDKKVMSGNTLQKMITGAIMTLVNNFLLKDLNRTLRNGVKLIYGEDVLTVDFSGAVAASDFLQRSIGDRRLCQLVGIQKAVVLDGGIELSLKYNVPV